LLFHVFFVGCFNFSVLKVIFKKTFRFNSFLNFFIKKYNLQFFFFNCFENTVGCFGISSHNEEKCRSSLVLGIFVVAGLVSVIMLSILEYPHRLLVGAHPTMTAVCNFSKDFNFRGEQN
jgi:hypothetical protein